MKTRRALLDQRLSLIEEWAISLICGVMVALTGCQREAHETLTGTLRPHTPEVFSVQTTLSTPLDHRLGEIKSLINAALSCDVTSLSRCGAWVQLISRYAYHLRRVVIHAPATYVEAEIWLKQGMILAKSTKVDTQILGIQILLIGARRLKYRLIPSNESLVQQTHEMIKREVDPLHQARLLSLLHELTPHPQMPSLFTPFISVDQPEEVQEQAWRIMIKRHALGEPISLKAIKRTMQSSPSTSVKASLISAASHIKSPLVVRWCHGQWWQTKLYEDCRDGLTALRTKSATQALWKWVDALFDEVDQALNSDRVLAEALTHLSLGNFTPRLKRRYLKLLDRFFSRRRSEEAVLLVAHSWLELRPKRFAHEVLLRYLKPNQTSIASQSYIFKQQLRNLVHLLKSKPQ